MRKPLFFLLLLALAACKGKSDVASPTIDFGPGDGFSYLNNYHQPTGPQDATDWTSDAVWTEQEKALFPRIDFDLNGPQRPELFIYSRIYPNPGRFTTYQVMAQDRGSFSISKYAVQIVLVDKNYSIVMQQGPIVFPYGFSLPIDYEFMKLHPSERYRLYYVLYAKDGLVCKGHGDIRYDE